MDIKRSSLGLLVLMLIAALTLPFTQPALAAPLSATVVVANANDSGAGSLRQVILDATSGDTITFSGNFTIKLASELSIAKNLTIDGSGHTITVSGDTNSDGVGETRVFNIAAGATLTLDTLSIVNGSSSNGGGILNAGTLTVLDSTLANNKSTGTGGGISTSGSLTVKNSTFSGNIASGNGGGIYAQGSDPVSVTNGTFSANGAASGGAIYRAAGTVTVTNTILANSLTGGNCGGSITNGGYNLDSGASCGFGSVNYSKSSMNPLLAPLGNFGGTTQTFALLPGSPALDAGDDSVCGLALGYLDQRGVDRVTSQCDMGAYESRGFTMALTGGDKQSAPINTAFAQSLQVTLSELGGNPLPGALITFTAPTSGASATWSSGTTTMSTTDSGGLASASQLTTNNTIGSYQVTASGVGGTPIVLFDLTNACSSSITVANANDSGTGSLRQAVANLCASGAINFNSDFTIRLASRLVIAKNLSISGVGHTVAISGDTNGDGTGETSLFINTTGVSAILDHLNLVNGKITTGGSILNNGSLTISNSTVANNNATTNAGAVYNTSILTVTNSTFTGNSTIGNGGGIYNAGTLNVTNSTFSGNSAANGGAIANTGTSSTLTVINSTLSGNTATSGGGIYKGTGTVTVNNTILTANATGGNCSGAVTDGGYNIDNGVTCGFGPAGNSKSSTDPLISSLGNNGGPAQTFALLTNSPAIDTAGAANCPATDQRGIARPQGSACDIGAYELKQYTISGNAGMPGVKLSYTNITAKTVTSASDGSYSFPIPTGWSGTVTPSLAGYIFNPSSKTYTNITSDQANQNYIAVVLYNISGNVGVAGATLTYTDNGTKTVTSASNGTYTLPVPTGWSGDVTPSLAGYIFTPDKITYTNVTANKTGQDYVATKIGYTISGNAGTGGVILSYTDGSSKTATADASGIYTLAVSYNWSGVVTPALVGYIFSPPSKTYTNVTSDLVNQNYTAVALYTISGNAGAAGVTLSYTDGIAKTATSASDGTYTLTVPAGWSGDVTPSLDGYTFTPAKITYTNVTVSKTGQDYVATKITYTIAGNAGTGSVTLSYTDGSAKTATADASGNYSFSVSYKWSGTVTPSKVGWVFTPPSITYTTLTTNQASQNYVATKITYTISGNAGLGGALLHYDDEGYKIAQADSLGIYSFEVSYSWSGTVTPSLAGYIFTPASKVYTNVLSPQPGQNYTAATISEPHIISGTISGNLDKASVVLTYDYGGVQSVPVTADGSYSFTVPYNWSGIVTPVLAGHFFVPANRVYRPVVTDQPAQDYTGYAPMVFKSVGAQDGWVLESGETSSKGGTFNAIGSTFSLGDDSLNRQYRAILSFDTSTLPANAIIKSVVVRIRQYGKPVGVNPFTVLGTLRVAIRKGTFGDAALAASDFEARASVAWVGTFPNTPITSWYSANLNATGMKNINRTGITQFRLYFSKDDNNDLRANLLRFVSGNRATAKPELIITYTLP